jgi:hypothetical protein
MTIADDRSRCIICYCKVGGFAVTCVGTFERKPRAAGLPQESRSFRCRRLTGRRRRRVPTVADDPRPKFLIALDVSGRRGDRKCFGHRPNRRPNSIIGAPERSQLTSAACDAGEAHKSPRSQRIRDGCQRTTDNRRPQPAGAIPQPCWRRARFKPRLTGSTSKSCHSKSG